MSTSLSRRIAERLLTMLLPRHYREALIGDLQEDTNSARYWREVFVALASAVVVTLKKPVCEEDLMSVVGTATHRPVAFSLALGVLGGGALITTAMISARGPLVFLPYAAIVIISAVILRAEAVQPFSRRFSLGLGAFMLATLIFYVSLRTWPKHVMPISILGHAWRIGFMLVIGSILSAAVAQITATGNHGPEPESAAG